jgi:hypothetical protein
MRLVRHRPTGMTEMTEIEKFPKTLYLELPYQTFGKTTIWVIWVTKSNVMNPKVIENLYECP